MESDYEQSMINDTLVDGEMQIQSLDDIVHESVLVRPTLLLSPTNTDSRFRYLNIGNISTSPSPLDTRSRVFQPGSLIDSKTFGQILSSVYAPPNMKRIDEDDDGNNNVTDEQLFGKIVLSQQREQEIQQLTQVIRTNLPKNDNMANIIMQQLNDILETTTTIINYDINNQAQNEFETSSIISTQHPYPPVNQTGPVEDHDRPYADYGHLNRQTIAEECDFNLQPPPPPPTKSSHNQQQPIRLNAKSFAITSWTNVSKDSVMNEIKDEFGIENIQYICIGEEISELNLQRHLHIQIIFKEKVDRRKPFLDEITQTRCNYQVTHNDCAWNEYIKKSGNCIEFNEFKSTKIRGQKQWPSPQSSSSSSILNYPTTTTTTTAARGRVEEKQRQKEEIARHAFHLAKTSINDALIFMRDNSSPIDFLKYSQWYKNTFTLLHLLEQYEMARTGNIVKEYTWPESFPDCTPALREVVDRWIREEFNRLSRAKCLILIRGTGTGKTTFAKSLSGQYNYFQGRWRLDSWKDSARYLIFDDIPWDKFDQLGFPPKKALLTQNGLTMATDKYKPSTEIYIRQPAIVLLNSDDAGSIIAEPITIEQQQIFDYWQHRAIIYRIGSDEYFHKPDYYRDDDVNQIPNNPSMNSLTNNV